MNLLKLILVSSAAVTLTGCAAIDAYFMSKYDNNEYALINKIRTLSEIYAKDCSYNDLSSRNFNTIYNISTELSNYSEYLPRNKEAVNISQNILALAKQGTDLYSNGTPSEGFCKLKLQQINRAATTAQQVIGKKPR
jgi:hypothetical protein